METFKSDGQNVVVHGYTDEAAYHKVVDDPAGAFCQALVTHRLEDMGQWVSSERGQTASY